MKTSMSIGELRALCELAWGEGPVALLFEPRRVRVRLTKPGAEHYLLTADLDETEEEDGVGQILAACAEKLSERAARAREMADYYRGQAQDAEQHAVAIEIKAAQIRALLVEDMAPGGTEP